MTGSKQKRDVMSTQRSYTRFGMGALALAGLLVSGSAQAAPFAPGSFHKGRSALVYDISTIDREGPYTRAWVYLIVRYPMDGATMVASRREFVCAADQSRARLEQLASIAAAAPPPAPSANPLEDVVRDMLRPILKQWLDDNLPQIVDEHVKREISRITGKPL